MIALPSENAFRRQRRLYSHCHDEHADPRKPGVLHRIPQIVLEHFLTKANSGGGPYALRRWGLLHKSRCYCQARIDGPRRRCRLRGPSARPALAVLTGGDLKSTPIVPASHNRKKTTKAEQKPDLRLHQTRKSASVLVQNLRSRITVYSQSNPRLSPPETGTDSPL